MKKLIAGNWKMNLDRDGVNQLVYDLMAAIPAEVDPLLDYLVCPPFPYLDRCMKFFKESPVAVGAQDCAATGNGAHTGDVSAEMLADLGCGYVIAGHSERRADHGESSALVRAKAAQAHAYGLKVIICVGETERERESGQAEEIVGAQLAGSLPESASAQNTVIAYEPVWAIGTGKVAGVEDIRAMHAFIREALAGNLDAPAAVPILYGGSVKPGNAAEIFAVENVDGALIGGASLKAADFLGIAAAVKG